VKDFFEFREDINEVLGFGLSKRKKAKADQGNKRSNDGSDDPHQVLTDKIDKLEAKLKATREKLKKAQGPDGDDDSEDYWGGIEMNQTQELEKLKDRLKKMQQESVNETAEWSKLDDNRKDAVRKEYQRLGKMHDTLRKKHDFEYNDIEGDDDKADKIMDQMIAVKNKRDALVDKFGRGVIKKVGFRQKK